MSSGVLCIFSEKSMILKRIVGASLMASDSRLRVERNEPVGVLLFVQRRAIPDRRCNYVRETSSNQRQSWADPPRLSARMSFFWLPPMFVTKISPYRKGQGWFYSVAQKPQNMPLHKSCLRRVCFPFAVSNVRCISIKGTFDTQDLTNSSQNRIDFRRGFTFSSGGPTSNFLFFRVSFHFLRTPCKETYCWINWRQSDQKRTRRFQLQVEHNKAHARFIAGKVLTQENGFRMSFGFILLKKLNIPADSRHKGWHVKRCISPKGRLLSFAKAKQLPQCCATQIIVVAFCASVRLTYG